MASHELIVSILVFVELALGLSAVPFMAVSYQGFNPCFCGTRPRTSCRTAIAHEHPKFQSLFLWNSPSDKESSRAFAVIRMFQSLFLWNSPSDCELVRRKKNIVCVSILVFVELALGRYSYGIQSRYLGVSILVFVELALGRSKHRGSKIAEDVSILVFVELALGHYIAA